MNLYEVAQELTTGWLHVPAQRPGAPPDLRRDEEVRGRSALEGLRPVQRVLPRRQRRRPGRQPPDRLDRGHPRADAPVRGAQAGDAAGARPRSATESGGIRCRWRAVADRIEERREQSVDLPAQHPHHPAGARGRARAGGDARRPRGSLPRRHRGEGVPVGLVPRGVADGGGRAGDLPVEPEAGRGMPARAPRPARRRHLRLAVRDRRLQTTGTSAATGRSRSCASGWRTGSSSCCSTSSRTTPRPTTRG